MTIHGKLSIISYILSFYFIYIEAGMPQGSRIEMRTKLAALILFLLGAFFALLQNRIGIVGICEGGGRLTDEDLREIQKAVEEEKKKIQQKSEQGRNEKETS